MFSLIRQLEDISGIHKFTVSRFAKYNVFLFGTADLHVFVITSPTSEGQVAKTLSELVATMNEIEPTIAASTMTGRGNEQAMTPMTSLRRDSPNIENQKFPPSRPLPEPIVMLQGYLLALDADCIIQEDIGGFYKIKTNSKDSRVSWPILEKINSAFKDKIEILNIGTDADGRVFVTISLK
jgi:hypothetical protein